MEQPEESFRNPADTPSLLDVTLLWRKKFQLLLFVFLAMAIGAGYLFIAQRSYVVTARLLVEPRGEVLDVGQPIPKDNDFLPTQAEIIRSPAVIRRAIENLPAVNLAALGVSPETAEQDLLEQWRNIVGGPADSQTRPAVGAERTAADGDESPLADAEAIAAKPATGDATEPNPSLDDAVVTVRRPNPFFDERPVPAPGVSPDANTTGEPLPAAGVAPSLPVGTLADRGQPAITGYVPGNSLTPPVMHRTVNKVLDELNVEPLLGTRVLSLQFAAYDKAQAAGVLDSVIQSYREFVQDREQSSHRETILLLAEREGALRQEIASLNEQFEKLHRSSPLLGRDVSAAEAQRASLKKMGELLSATQQRRIQLENYRSELALLNERDRQLANDELQLDQPTTMVGAAAGTAESSTLLTLRGQQRAAADLLSRMSREGVVSFEDPESLQQSLSEALVREAELSQKFGHKHPEIRAVRGLILSLRERIDQTVVNAPEMVDRELESVREHESRLTSAYEEEFSRMKEIDAFLLREEQALSEVERVKLVHDTILTQLNELQLADEAVSEGRSSVAIRILDGPTIDPDQTWPKPLPVLALCAVVGACGGFVLVSAGEQLRAFTRPAPRPQA